MSGHSNLGGMTPKTLSEGGSRKYVQGYKPMKFLTATERAEKSAKELCYFCDQPYEKGHKCKTQKIQLFLVEIPGDKEESKTESGDGEIKPVDFEMLETDPYLSLHAVSGMPGFQTMRVI